MATLAHIYGPTNSSNTAGGLIDLDPFNGVAFDTAGALIGSVGISAEQKAALPVAWLA